MKVIDVNLLVYLTNSSAPAHAGVVRWWEALVSSRETIGLPWFVLTGYVRIVTQPRVMATPARIDEACGYVNEWLHLPSVKIITEPPEVWPTFQGLLSEAGRAGNLVTDAHLAAIAIGNGATLCSCDTDFARFSKLRWENPLAAD